MIPEAAVVRLTPADRAVLEGRIRAPTAKQRDVFRAKRRPLDAVSCPHARHDAADRQYVARPVCP